MNLCLLAEGGVRSFLTEPTGSDTCKKIEWMIRTYFVVGRNGMSERNGMLNSNGMGYLNE